MPIKQILLYCKKTVLLLDFSLTVKAATLIFISGCGLATPSAKEGKVSKGAKIRNRYNQVPHLTQDTNGKVTNSQ